MKKLWLLLALCAACVPLASKAQDAQETKAQEQPATTTAPALSPKDKADLVHIETYLNGLKNVSADFLQFDDMGGMLRGSIAISRPGKMKVTYAPPSEDFIIADGNTIHIWDANLQAQTNIDQRSNLAEFILRDPIKLNGDVIVTKFERFPNKIEVTLMQAADEGAGRLTLIFDEHPFKLRQWKVLDEQGHMTGVNLENMSTEAVFPDSLFVFSPPNFGKRPRS